jgi:hypothetical protein
LGKHKSSDTANHHALTPGIRNLETKSQTDFQFNRETAHSADSDSDDHSASDNSGLDPDTNLTKKEKKKKRKFFNEGAEKLERSLIDKEFYKIYTKSTIYWTFALVFLSNVFINVDHGSLPGCSIQIKHDFNMNNF